METFAGGGVAISKNKHNTMHLLYCFYSTRVTNVKGIKTTDKNR